MIHFGNQSIYDTATDSSGTFERYDQRLTDALSSHYSMLPAIIQEFCENYEQNAYVTIVRQVLNQKGLQMHDRQINGYACLCFFVEKVGIFRLFNYGMFVAML